jgi:hypothetical protein
MARRTFSSRSLSQRISGDEHRRYEHADRESPKIERDALPLGVRDAFMR